MRPQGRVQAAHEQGAGDGGIDGRPVQGRQGQELLDIRQLHREGVIGREQAAVEPVHLLEPDKAPGGHGAEQGLELPLRQGGVALGRLQELREQLVGQQVDVLGEQAEQHLLAEVGHAEGVMPPPAPGLGQGAQLGRRLFGELGAGRGGSQPLRLEKGPLEEVELGRLAQIRQAQVMPGRDQAGEGGVDADELDIGNDEEGRILQGGGVELELPEGRVQVLALAGALVLPGKATAPPDIGPPLAPAGLAGPLLEAEPVPLGIGLGRAVDADQGAEVEEVFLGGLFLSQGYAIPFADKVVRSHRASWLTS